MTGYYVHEASDFTEQFAEEYGSEISAGSVTNHYIRLPGFAHLVEFPGNCSTAIVYNIQRHLAAGRWDLFANELKVAQEFCEHAAYAQLMFSIAGNFDEQTLEKIEGLGFHCISEVLNHHSNNHNLFFCKRIPLSDNAVGFFEDGDGEEEFDDGDGEEEFDDE